MTVVNVIDRITQWAEENICKKVRLKLPDDNQGGGKYSYRLVQPAAFSMYVPASDRLPQGVGSPVPSLCVRLLEGQDSLAKGSGKLNIQFCFSAWDTGCHSRDIFAPQKGTTGAFENNPQGEAEAYCRSGDGWRDAWNFVDTALRAIESAQTLNGVPLAAEDGIRFGPLKEQETIPDFYPLWFAWVSFSVQYPLARARPWENLL